MSVAAWFPDVPVVVLLIIPWVVIAGYTVFGATGFGSSLLIVPFLAHWFALSYAVPLISVVDFAAVVNANLRQWRYAVMAEVQRLVPAMLIGVGAGAFLLVKLPR